MKTQNEILKELQQIAPNLAALEKTNPYTLPDGYFVNFKNVLLEKLQRENIKVELSALAPELSKLETISAVNIPAKYFSDFSSRLVDKIRAQEALNELAEIAPALSKLEKINAFEVPANYFSTFPGKILSNATQPQGYTAPANPKWMQSLNLLLEQTVNKVFKPKYTFAFAGLTTTVIIAVLMFTKINQCTDLECKFAQLSSEEINVYLDTKSDMYSDEIFEMTVDEKLLPGIDKENSTGIYKDALKDVDDAALNSAITD